MDRQKHVDHAEARDGTAYIRVLDQHGKTAVTKEIIYVPPVAPRKEDQEDAELNPEKKQGDSQRTVHLIRLCEIQAEAATPLALGHRRDAIGDVAIVDVHRVHVAERIERSFRFARGFQRSAKIVAEREDRLLFEARRIQCALIPE